MRRYFGAWEQEMLVGVFCFAAGCGIIEKNLAFVRGAEEVFV